MFGWLRTSNVMQEDPDCKILPEERRATVDWRIEGWVDSNRTRTMIDRGGKINVRAIGAMPRGRHSHGESRANVVQSQGRVEQRPRPVISNDCEAARKTVTLFLRHACFATPAHFNYLLKVH